MCYVSSRLIDGDEKPVSIIIIWNRNDAEKVRLGDLVTNSFTDDARPAIFDIAEIIKHPQYRRPPKYHDIALLRLDRKVTFSRYIRPACLPQVFGTGTQRAIASGWGAQEYSGPGSPTLLKVTLELFSGTECNETFFTPGYSKSLRNGIDDESQMCAGSHTEWKDTCQVSSWTIGRLPNLDGIPFLGG